MNDKYAPHMTSSKLGKQIYYCWQLSKTVGRCKEWDDYETFFMWCLNNGASVNRHLVRKDITSDYSPDNCLWYDRKRYVNPDEVQLHDFTPEYWDRICADLRERFAEMEGTND